MFALEWSKLFFEKKISFNELGAKQSHFAEITINLALQAAWISEVNKLNLKKFPKHPNGLFLLGLGKLGGLDLNFSSDVDLIAFYDPDILPIPVSMGQTYIVNKVLKKLGQILNPRNKPNFVWRVDWRLRPESSASQLVMSVDMARDFYFFRALPWHRLALMKAGVIAGDLSAGKKFLSEIETFVWRKNLDFRSLDDLAFLKSRINLEHPELVREGKFKDHVDLGTNNFNFKLGKGGIREIEFIANALQLIWGGKQPQLRTTNTLKALNELTKLNHIEHDISSQLSRSYERLRTIENIIQMLSNEQVHKLPKNDIKKDKILKILELSDWKSFDKEIIGIRNFVHSEFNKLFVQNDSDKLVDKKHGADLGALKPNIRDIANNWLNGFIPITKDPVKFQPLGRALLNQIFSSSVNADEAIFRVNNFLSAISRSEQYLDLLYRNQKLLDSLVPPIIHSSHMTLLLEQSPHIIDIFLYPENEMDISHLFNSSDYGSRLESLRRFVNEHLYLYYTKYLSKSGGEKLLFKNLTNLADTTIKAALMIVADDLKINEMPLTVLGLGKMGCSRMAPLSDVDLIFIFDNKTDHELAHKIVRRLRTVLTAKLNEGVAYELDMRLRPSGRSGPPAVKFSSFKSHHHNKAHNWEHVALVNSRIIAGNKKLGIAVKQLCSEVISKKRDKEQFLHDTKYMWELIKSQRIQHVTVKKFNSKLREGGLMQAEYINNCHNIIGVKDYDLKKAITFWSKIQVWERLLNLTGKSLKDIPEFYKERFLEQFSVNEIKDIEILKVKYVNLVKLAYSNLFRDIQLEKSYEIKRIIWKST